MMKIFSTAIGNRMNDNVKARLEIVESFKNLDDAFYSYESFSMLRNKNTLLIKTCNYFLKKLKLDEAYN